MRLRSILIVAAAAALLTASCGGGGGAASAKAKILRVGTTYYVDSFNPLIGIETQDSTADEMVYPQLDAWTGFPATLWGFCKCFYTSPKPAS